MLAPLAASATQAAAPPAIAISATPGTYSDAPSNVAAARQRARPNRATPSGLIATSERGYPLQRVAHDAGALVAAGARRQQQPVRQHRPGQFLHVVGQRVIAPVERRLSLRSPEQHQPGARR